MRYEIRWYGSPETTTRAARGYCGRAPRGGKRGYRTRERAQVMLRRYLERCGQWAGTVEAAHSPRIVAALP